jgi:hypothetical protein
VWMQLPLLVKFGKIWHHQRRRANPWWAAEQGSLQPVFTPILAQRPCNSGCFCSLQIVVDGSEADRTTTGRSPRPTSNLNLRTSLVLRTDNLLAGKRSSLSWGGYSPLCCPAPLALWKFNPGKPNAVPGSA